MAPITVTETEIIEEQIFSTSCVEYKLTNTKDTFLRDFNGKQCKNDAYDQVRCSDPKFLLPLRQWEKRMGFLTPIRWINAIAITAFHIIGVVWLVRLLFWNMCTWKMFLYSYVIGQIAGFGVTAGAHRLWCHRSYKAKRPLHWILVICFSAAGQNTIYDWVRDHRVHHKFSETNADPHNSNRGFFFSHVGWLMMKKHPDVLREGAKMDMSDITSDPIIQFHTKYFILFKVLFCWFLPSLIPALCWDECWETSIVSQVVIRYIMTLNFTWSVNSFAHIWGNKPYDRQIMPVENWGVSLIAMGEGWHNYHHTFPWDYKASELGMPLNLTTTLLDFFAKIGWAYDMKQASPSLVEAVAKSRGNPEELHNRYD